MDDKVVVTCIAVMDADGKPRTAQLGVSGGKIGQVLTKSSDAEGDHQWSDPVTLEDVRKEVATGVNEALGNIGAVLDAINGEVV